MSASSAAAPLLRGSERGNSLNRQGWSLCDVDAVSLTLPFHNLSILEISLTCSAPSPVVPFWSRSAAAMSRLPVRKPDKTHRAEALQTPNASRQCGGPCPPLMCVGGTGTSHRSEALSPLGCASGGSQQGTVSGRQRTPRSSLAEKGGRSPSNLSCPVCYQQHRKTSEKGCLWLGKQDIRQTLQGKEK